MNKITTWVSSRLAMALLLVMSFTCAMAQNVITIDPVTINSAAGVTVPVNLNSTTNIRTIIFDVTLPDGVAVAGKPVLVAERLDMEEGETPASLYTVDVNRNPDNKGSNVWRIGLFGKETYSAIVAGEGAFVNLNLSITEEAFFAGGEFTETISTEKTPSVEGSEFEITIVAPESPVADVTVPAEIEVVSGEKTAVAVSLENNLPVSAIMFDVELGEGLTLAKTGRRYDLTYGPRWSEENNASVIERENGVRIIVTNVSSNVIAAAGEGTLLSFYVIADDTHFKSQINVSGINASMKWNGQNQDVYCDDQTVEVINTELFDQVMVAVEEDETLINDLVTAYSEFVAELGETFPAFLETHAEELSALYARIEALNDLYVEALVEAEETGIYNGVSTEEMTEVTSQFMALVTTEAEELTAIENAAMADMEALAELEAKIDAIIEEPDNYSDETVDKAVLVMADLYEYSNAIWEAEATAKQETGVYVSPLNEEILEALSKAIDEILATTSIETIVVETADAVYYNINGQVVSEPVAGKLYIKVVNGKASKVIR